MLLTYDPRNRVTLRDWSDTTLDVKASYTNFCCIPHAPCGTISESVTRMKTASSHAPTLPSPTQPGFIRRLALPFLLLLSHAHPLALRAAEGWATTEQKEAWKTQAQVFLDKPQAATRHPDSVINSAYIAKIRGWLAGKDYAAIEAEAGRLRTGAVRLESSAWGLAVFHMGIRGAGNGREDALREIEEWMKKEPKSVTAMVSWVDTMTSWAWDARGGGYADTVTEEGGKLFAERLGKAEKFIQQHPEMEGSAMGWMVKLTVLMGQGAKRDAILKMGEQAVAKFPDYGQLYDLVGRMLLPRWYGQPGDAEEWLKHSTAKLPQPAQDEIYASVSLVWLRNEYLSERRDKVFSSKRLDWTKIRSGAGKVLAKHPKSTWLAGNYFIAATQAGDTDAALEIYATWLRGEFDRADTTKPLFEKMVDWMAKAHDLTRSK